MIKNMEVRSTTKEEAIAKAESSWYEGKSPRNHNKVMKWPIGGITMFMDHKQVQRIKEQYPEGTRIRLLSMDDPYAPILPGAEGSVSFVDDAGQIHMKWDNGRGLALIPGEDSFSVISRPEQTELQESEAEQFGMKME